MRFLKAFVVAFSMYSRIPMPRFTWDSEDMKYHLIFFPWVGAVIGAMEYGLLLLGEYYDIPLGAFVALAMALPLIVTGGFHLDGFMDVADAVNSFKSKEERLEILKDPHIGAFSIINVITAGLLCFAGLFMMNRNGFIGWCFSFFMARSVSGIMVIKSKKAKENGMLYSEAKNSADKVVFAGLIIELLICTIFAFYFVSLQAIILLLLTLAFYKGTEIRANRAFGGITGDVAGYYVVITEVFMAIFFGIISLV
ncbi:cobalamin-5'-phosphate synthase [Pseudobutyrivibrio sp. OR37]|uniref:adenosylcobinamide-GDP ribazoletransferase n=1 Tax=Pseudobutyrivibrio sp. OR37 TaxID=1798186 RepID=UPI0008E4CA2B|nr:adenosylcobinamide-GDP ribazoletransferase [Pseudobutyrivibrio sp. OR37]SFH53722.1 cobalamin-5'-phosphate synthase [Pseudobutyrivibrio sp. OR37]